MESSSAPIVHGGMSAGRGASCVSAEQSADRDCKHGWVRCQFQYCNGPIFIRGEPIFLVGSELLAVAVPSKGQLLVTSAVARPEIVGAFMSIAEGIYKKNEGGRQLSPTVFLVSEGKITGAARLASEPPPPPKEKKGFLKRLFS